MGYPVILFLMHYQEDGLEMAEIGWLIEKLYERLKTDTIHWSISDSHTPSLGFAITTDSQFCGKTQA